MKTKILAGRELASFIKERQSHEVHSLKSQGITPKLAIIRDSDNPVITKYVNLKIRYGEDIGIIVVDEKVKDAAEAKSAIEKANNDNNVHGIIVQLPLKDKDKTDEVVKLIAKEKDVDGLSGHGDFDSATATSINWLLAGHNINLNDKKIAIVGKGRLVGAPLIKMWQDSGYNITVFDHDSDLSALNEYDVIVTATGAPHLIQPSMIKPGAILVDAGTASENGVLVGDIDDATREDRNIAAITPKVGGVGPLTVAVLFEDVIIAAKKQSKSQ